MINFVGGGDALNAMGISIDDPCDASALISALMDETSALIKETKESIDLISAKAGAGNFLSIVISILGDFAAAAVGELVDGFLTDMLYGNLLGSISSMLTMMLTALQGVEIIILYYATDNLAKQLKYRIAMGQILVSELSFLLDFIHAINQAVGDEAGAAS